MKHLPIMYFINKTMYLNFFTKIIACALFFSSCASHYDTLAKKAAASTLSPTNFKVDLNAREYCNTFIIKVKIKDEILNFAVKTEYEFSQISPKALKLLGMKNWKVETAINDVEIGNIRFSKAFFQVSKVSNFLSCCDEDIHGILGTDILSKAIWQFDYPNRRLMMTSHLDSLTFPKQQYIIPFFTYNDFLGTPYCQVRLNQNYLCDTYIGTGITDGFCLENKIINVLSDTAKYILEYHAGKRIGRAFEKIVTKSVFAQHFSLENTLPLDSIWATNNSFNRSYIGNNTLANYNLTIDWKSKKMIFCDKQTSQWNGMTNGFYYYYNDDVKKVLIYKVIKNSPAYNAEIEVGSEVVSVEDTYLDKMTKQEYLDWVNANFDVKKQSKYYRIKKNKDIEQVYLKYININTLWRRKNKEE